MGEVANAVKSCPFLHAISEFQGEECAARLALNPFQFANVSRPQPILPEDPAGSIAAVFKLFHGKQGPIPLSERKAAVSQVPPVRCPMHPASSSASEKTDLQIPEPELSPCPALPMMASISLSGFKFLPDPGDIFRRNNQQQRPKPRNQKKHHQNQGKEPPKPQQQQNPSNSTTSSSSPSSHASSTKGPRNINNNTNSGKSSMRSTFGPLGGLLPLAAASGKLTCPPAIVAMRAAIAGLKPVRHLRPQALPIRSLAMAGTAIMANVPCGMWREHTKKFGPEWFIAVHATIPFVAMLRKAVLMPRWAILLTIAGAIAGQQMGAKLEKARLHQCGISSDSVLSRSCAGQEQQLREQGTRTVAVVQPRFGVV